MVWHWRYLTALSRNLTIRGCHAVFYHGFLITVLLDTRHFCNSLPRNKPVFVWYQKSGPTCSLSWAVVSLCLSLFLWKAMRVSDENRTSCKALKCMNLFFCFVPLIQKSLYPVEIVRILMAFLFTGCRSQ